MHTYTYIHTHTQTHTLMHTYTFTQLHHNNYISSVESQKGAIAVQMCSIEIQKGAITIDLYSDSALLVLNRILFNCNNALLGGYSENLAH